MKKVRLRAFFYAYMDVGKGREQERKLCTGWTDRYLLPAISALPPSVVVVLRKEPATYMDVGR
jgi:hypothetical protein